MPGISSVGGSAVGGVLQAVFPLRVRQVAAGGVFDKSFWGSGVFDATVGVGGVFDKVAYVVVMTEPEGAWGMF